MEAYRLFWVGTLKFKQGKAAEAQKWWREKGRTKYSFGSMDEVVEVLRRAVWPGR